MQIAYDCTASQASMRVQIYYWEHDQSEERPLAEFFRGDDASLVQWQPPVAHPPGAGGGVQGGASITGVPMQARVRVKQEDVLCARTGSSVFCTCDAASAAVGFSAIVLTAFFIWWLPGAKD